MSTSLAKSSKSKSPAQMLIEAVKRAGEMYEAAVKRAEADYFERLKKATEAAVGNPEVIVPPPPPPQQTEPQQATA
jgi:hypothetical protein